MHLVDPVTHERGILKVQIGSQGVRQVHAHLLSGFCSTTFLSHQLCSLLTGTPSGGRIS